MDSFTWRSILLRLEPEDIRNLCQVNVQLKEICQDESFYREYFVVREREPPPPLNLQKYYFDFYTYRTQAQRWIHYLKDESRCYPGAWNLGIRVPEDGIVKFDYSIFQGIVEDPQIRIFLEEVKRLEHTQDLSAEINIRPNNNIENNYSLIFFAEMPVHVEDKVISEEAARELIARFLFRGAYFVDIENSDIINLENIE